MVQIRVVEDSAECERIWAQVWPRRSFFDLWPVRACFASGFNRQPYFVIAERAGKISGLLALTWIEEDRYFGHFPGETHRGKTWLEQNRIPGSSPELLAMLLDRVPGPVHLRYLTGDTLLADCAPLAVDEVGYLFYPGNYQFSFRNYMESFSGKSRKKLTRELAGLEALGVSYRFDHQPDVHELFAMNKQAFASASYFADPRFLASFEQLVGWLRENGMLRVITLMLGGVVAAIDIGVIWQKTYTLLAGATNPEFLGVAKLINFHHMEWACEQHFESVDFLCGDFGWKKRFHLSSRPLYEINRQSGANTMHETLRRSTRADE